MSKKRHKSSKASAGKSFLPPSSYDQLMGSPMDASDHPVDNVGHPHGNYTMGTNGPSNYPGNLNTASPTIS